ncbi:hypothetical protein BCR35DRAFT_287252 [Leucosporidium creatinivorum]|uniref:Uncharacterized protein n=1 Tax=Leucosporidium creatinivorum TaxID=106004 RepID=A0A1Y2G063_9BASI|nr:hypothetical protein BCR35DRAFT_287252 [Leucosporidium creatinivorum]
MPSYPVKLVLDDQPTSYDDPFLRYKTTERSVYDAARARPGATLHPSPEPGAPPFDTIMYNTKSEVTETTIANVAFRFHHLGADSPFVTPASSCGLLEGVKRAELLEKGDLIEDVITVEQIKEAAKVSGRVEVDTERRADLLRFTGEQSRRHLLQRCTRSVQGISVH